MSDEIERLRADLACLESAVNVLERHSARSDLITVKISSIRDKIARLEEAESDPWREAKEAIPLYIENGDTSKHAGYLIALLTHAILRIDESLKAIERRIDKADDYIQEQNERDIEP